MDSARNLYGYVVAVGLTVLATGVIALVRLELDVANVSLLYVLVVLVVAARYGTGPSLAACIPAFLAFNFFFVEPKHTLAVTHEEDWVNLGLLLVSGVITGRLAAGLRDRAQDAHRREREAAVLYDVVRLMGERDVESSVQALAERLCAELAVAAVSVTLMGEGGVQVDVGDADNRELARQALDAPGLILSGGAAPTGADAASPGRWVRVVSPERGARRSGRLRSVPISVNGERAGALAVVARPGAPQFSREEGRLLSAVANQVGLALARRRLQTEANEAEVLRRTDELRTALMNAVSHDLRTPLASIIASASSLMQSDVDWSEAERERFLRAIEGEAGRLNRLVGNLLDISRIEAGSIRPEKSWYELGSLIREVVGRLEFAAGSHKVTLDLPDELPPLHFDYVEIDQVLTNLIENAIRHTPPSAEVTISAAVDSGLVRVEVADDGPGLSSESISRVFETFYRGPALAGSPRGAGLGLAVAQGLVEAHGGRIRVSNRPGGGASFVFELPLSAAGKERRPA